MSELLFLTVCNKRTLENIIDENIQSLVIENKYLISALTNFTPQNDEEYRWARTALKRYKVVQTELRTLIPIELLESIKIHQYPRKHYKNTKLSSKNQRRLDTYIDLIKSLRWYESRGKLQNENVKTIHKYYLDLQYKLRKVIPEKDLPVFEKTEPPRIKPKKEKLVVPASCEICGFPVSTMLTNHHVIPVSKGGKDTVKLCPSCHYIVHKSVDRGGIEEAVRDYYAPFDGVVEKLEMYVRKAVEA